jgi:hypothetical protein
MEPRAAYHPTYCFEPNVLARLQLVRAPVVWKSVVSTKGEPGMSEFSETLKVLASAPQVKLWFPIGLIAGAFFGALCWGKPRTLFAVTAIVIAPPAILLLPLTGADVLAFILLVLYVMTGFIGFCVGWIPGLWIGCLYTFSFGRKQSDQELNSPGG